MPDVGNAISDNLVILAIIGLLGNTLATVIGQFIQARNVRKRDLDAANAKVATERVRRDAALATKAAANAARKLVEAAKTTNQGIGYLTQIAEDTNATGHVTHGLVNSARTDMLLVVFELRKRVAADNPTDKAAQEAVTEARRSYEEAISGPHNAPTPPK